MLERAVAVAAVVAVAVAAAAGGGGGSCRSRGHGCCGGAIVNDVALLVHGRGKYCVEYLEMLMPSCEHDLGLWLLIVAEKLIEIRRLCEHKTMPPFDAAAGGHQRIKQQARRAASSL